MSEIQGKTASLKWLAQLLSIFSRETITIPTEYRDRVLDVKAILNNAL